MIVQLRKLKSKAIVVVILALLAITWQFLNYITIKEYVPLENFTSFEFIIVYSSYLFILILFLAILSLMFTVFRVSIKYNSELKQKEKILKNRNTISINTENPVNYK